MIRVRLGTRSLLAGTGLGVALLSVFAVQQIGSFRRSVAAASRAAEVAATADGLLAEYMELQDAARAFRLSGDASFAAPRLDERRRGQDALSRAERRLDAARGGARTRSPEEREEDAYLAQLSDLVRRRLEKTRALAEGRRSRVLPPEELKRLLRADAAKVALARRLVAAVDGLTVRARLADDPRTPWDERGSGVLAAILALAALSLLAMVVEFLALRGELRGRRAAEARALESRRQLEQILDASPDPVCLKDRGCHIVWANRAACEFAGAPLETLRGRRASQGLQLPDIRAYLRDDADAFGSRRTHETIYEDFVRADGARRVLHVLRRPILDEKGEPVMLVLLGRDITEQRAAERKLRAAEADARERGRELETAVRERTEQLLKSQDSLRQAQKMEAVGRLAGGVAHDFNNILTVIQGYAAFLEGHGDSRVRSDAREIQDAVGRAAGVTRQLLQFGRRRPREEQRALDLNGAVSSVERLLARVLGETVRVETRLEPGRPWVSAGPADLEQVLLNLAVNARDAMPRGGRVLIETGVIGLIGDAALADGAYACVTVTDEGGGIARELQARIFEPFFTTKGPDKGTGLGLATVYAIARRLGGDARVESEPGRGASFRVLLPLTAAGADASVMPEPPSSPGEEARARSGAVVLLVEDQESLRRMLARALREAGCAVIEAGDAAQGLREAADPGRRVDVLLSDVVMPGMRGPELAVKLLAERPGLKALLMSGYLDDAGAPVVLPPGVPLLRKPAAPAAVVAAVEAALAAPAAA